MTETLATVALAASTFPLSVLIKITGVLAVALVAVRILRPATATLRHLVLACAFGAVAALPVVAVVAPAMTVTVERPAPVSPVVLPITVATVADQRNGIPPMRSEHAAAAGDIADTPARSALPLAAWAAGATIAMVPVLLIPARLRRLRRTARHWGKGDDALQTIGAARHRACVLLHDEVTVPLTCGVIRPAIILPVDAPRWSDDDLRHALVHEMEHVRRADWAVHVATRVVCALYWFHPLVWLAWRRLRLEAERACDDAVLRNGEPAAYAEQLVTLARRQVIRAPVPPLSMAGPTDLSTRVRALLDETQVRGPVSAAATAAVVAAAVLCTVVVAPLSAAPIRPVQAPSDAPAFDVVSIRENRSGDQGQRINRLPGGRVVTSNFPLRNLILFAYGLQPQQLIGGPDWMDSARWDITAQAPGEFPITEPGTVGAPQLMMQRMLADRFRLAVHTETRELPIYALTLARADRRLGSQIQPAAIDCLTVLSAALAKAKQEGGGLPPSPQRPNGAPGCGTRFDGRTLSAGGTSMAALARSLSGMVGRLVEDRTGLEGGFDFDLEFAVDPALAAAGAPRPADDANLPSIFTALQEQLGLKLDAARAPVEVLVIDSVDRPAEN